MSVTQWFEVNGYDSRSAASEGAFSTNRQSLTFNGQVDPASTAVQIYTYRTAKAENGETVVREYLTTVDKSQINADGTFTAYGITEMSGDVRFELQATAASGNLTLTRISGTVNGNNQSMQIVSENEVMKADAAGNWHSYSRDIEVRGQVEPGSTQVRVQLDRETYTVDNINADGSFTLSLKDLDAGQHTITLKSTDADGNSGKDVYSISVGQQYGGGAVVIDKDENVAVHQGATSLGGSVLYEYYLEKGGKTPGVMSFSVNGQTAAAGETLAIEGIGSIRINYDGGYSLHLNNLDYVGRVPDITYQVSNGTDTDSSVLSVRVNDINGNAYTESLQAANNADGADNTLEGRLSSDVLIGDTRNSGVLGIGEDSLVYTVKATHDVIEGNSGNDILFGDNVSTAGLNFAAGDGSDAYQALRVYVAQKLGNGSDDAVRSFIVDNWQKLLDSSGNGGNDVLRGEIGNDVLIGGAGNDVLIGGTGRDQFVFVTNSNTGRDIIKDFDSDYDRLVFTETLSSKNAVWNDAEHTLTFTGVKDGQTYQNSITFENIESGLTLEDVLKTQQVLA